MSIFKKAHKSPADIVKSLKSVLHVLFEQQTSGKKMDKAFEDLMKNLASMKSIMCGTDQHEPQSELVAQLSQELYKSETINIILTNLSRIDFEGKKDFTQIFNTLARRQIGSRQPTVEFLCKKKNILDILVEGYNDPDIALNCGIMLRECIRYESLAKIVFESENFFKFFEYVEMSTFDIASDAFATFKDLLTRHKVSCSEFLIKNYDRVFPSYTRLLESENYVTRRQSLKLLGELLLDRHNYTIMTRYISKPENLKIMMNNLRDQSRNIQFEAFHVFKVKMKRNSLDSWFP
ncbi:calcium-binding protein 39-like [Clavelina lepadiformis]|uniref:calcium-binding protein 39-like n=1 Tax=Clavelina lepadiformis TaxID=159417 RepID=UPI004042C1FC